VSGRSAVALSDREVRDFLHRPHTMALATNGPDGWPHVVAMWYGFLDGALGFMTYRRSQKLRNLERDPRVSCLVEDGASYDVLRGVLLRGRAHRIDAEDERVALAADVTERYQGPLDDAGRRAMQAAIAKRVVFVVEVDDVVSWDHRKLAGR
jgi:PPOX class probable F420-dependent enzyme